MHFMQFLRNSLPLADVTQFEDVGVSNLWFTNLIQASESNALMCSHLLLPRL